MQNVYFYGVKKEKLTLKNITFRVKIQKNNNKIKNIKRSFSAGKITQYSGLVWLANFIKNINWRNNSIICFQQDDIMPLNFPTHKFFCHLSLDFFRELKEFHVFQTLPKMSWLNLC